MSDAPVCPGRGGRPGENASDITLLAALMTAEAAVPVRWAGSGGEGLLVQRSYLGQT